MSGSFDSSGDFSVTGSAGFRVTAGPAYLEATASLTIDNSGFRVAISGRAGIRIAGINVGVSVNGVASLSGSQLLLDAQACLTINLLFTSFDICVGVTFSIGSAPGTPPGSADTNPPPSIGSVSGGTLGLDLNQLGGVNASNMISILDEGVGSVRVLSLIHI